MINLVSVHLENFRTFNNATFTPDAEGITAITGVNGAGKSSIVIGIMFALYGVTPDGVNVRDLRKQETQDPVIAEVTLRHNNQIVTVTRSLRGKNDTTTAKVEIDGEEQTNISSRTATQWVTARLGLDAEAFLTAFVVRQKELDALIKARPAERRKTIERLAGIERMSKALEKARANLKERKTVLAAFPPIHNFEETVERYEHQAATAEEERRRAEQYLQQLTEDISALGEEILEANNTLQEITHAAEQINTYTALITEKRTRISMLENQKTGLRETSQAAENIPTLEECENNVTKTQTAYDAINSLRLETEKKEALANQASGEASAAKTELDEKKTVAKKLFQEQKTHSENPPTAENETHWENQKEILSQQISFEQEKHAVLTAHKTRLEKSLAILTAHSEDGEHSQCPTCRTTLEDPSKLIKEMQVELADTVTQIDDVVVKGQGLRKQLDTVNSNLTLWKNHKHVADQLSNKLDSISQQVRELEERHVRLEDSAETFAEDAFATRQKYETVHSQEASLESELVNAQRELALRQAADIAAEQLRIVEETLAETQSELLQHTENYSMLTSQIGERSSLEDATANVAKLTDQRQRKIEEKFQVSQHINSLQNDVGVALRAAETAKDSQEKHQQAAGEVLVAETTVSALDDFRKDRVARLAPELSEIASDIISTVTDGYFVSLTLDDEFTPYLMTRTGQERPASWLSGGEESAVAFALRIAIGDVISNGNPGFLFLDEVMTAQDPVRRGSLMKAIQNIPRQIITISHTADATDVVDCVYDVQQSTEGYSQIVETSRDKSTEVDDTKFLEV